MEKVKIEKIVDLLEKTPTDDGTYYGCLYDLYVLIKIAKGADTIEHGKWYTLKELEKEMEELHERIRRGLR